MKKLTREMLLIEPNKDGQDCIACPFKQNLVQTCTRNGLNYDLCEQIDEEFCANNLDLACDTHSITIKPEYK